MRVLLRSGSLLLMAGATQRDWLHALPRDEACEGVRYNLTFRRVLTSEEDPRLLCLQGAVPPLQGGVPPALQGAVAPTAALFVAPASAQTAAVGAALAQPDDAATSPPVIHAATAPPTDAAATAPSADAAQVTAAVAIAHVVDDSLDDAAPAPPPANAAIAQAVEAAIAQLDAVSRREVLLPGIPTGSFLVERRHASAVSAAFREAGWPQRDSNRL